MSTQFDAYYRWLGIPPNEQPPHHYRLLGINAFEPDLEVIRDAATQRMAHVRSYQLGQHQALSQKILNELAAAKSCLLDPQKKAAYDADLKSKMDRNVSSANSTEATAPDPLAFLASALSTEKKPSVGVTRETPPKRGGDSMVVPKAVGRSTANSFLPRWGMIASGIAAACVIVVIMWLLFGGSKAKELTVVKVPSSGDPPAPTGRNEDRSYNTALTDNSKGESPKVPPPSPEPKTASANTPPAGGTLPSKALEPTSHSVEIERPTDTLCREMTIKAVSPQVHGITVVYQTDLGEKTVELGMSRKAEITLNGKDATLDALAPGLKAKVSYDKNLAVVTKVEATGTVAVAKQPELVEVSELNDEGANDHPWLSEDGLTIYWDRSAGSMNKGSIWTAHRPNSNASFDDKNSLFAGKCPTVSSDGLEMFLVGDKRDGSDDKSLLVATRETLDQPFSRPKEIRELRNLNAWGPVLSHDGLSLFFGSQTKGMQATTFCSVRKDKSSPWDMPTTLPALQVGQYVSLSFVAGNGLAVLGMEGRNMFISSKPSFRESFGKPSPVQFDGAPLLGLWPRYVAASQELFFARPHAVKGKGIGLWVVKNFKLMSPASEEGSGKTGAVDRGTKEEDEALRAAKKVPVDLLALVVPDQHRILGTWEEQNGELVATGKDQKNAFASCTIPYKATGSYLLHVEFTRLVGWPIDYAGPTFAFPVGKATAQFWLDIGPQQAHCGFSTTENDDVRFNKTGSKSSRLQNNTRYEIDIRTTVLPKGRARIEVALNGKPFYHWIGQQEELMVSPFWKYPSDGSFGLGVRGKAIFHKATVLAVGADYRSR